MGWLDDIFSSSKTENANSSQTGKSNTQGNLWPEIQPFLQNYLSQYSSENLANASSPINAYQTGAADQQSGVAGSLTGAQNAAAGVANNGISASDIQSFMSPYTQSVIDPTIQSFKDLNAATTSDINGNLAKNNALGNSNNSSSRARVLAPIQNQQQAQIASLYNTGYGQARDTAAQSAGLKVQGAGTQGQVANAQTGANTALGNLGQTIQQDVYANNLTPYSLQNQGTQGLATLGNIAGSNTQSSGTATGTSTTTANPSMWSDGKNLLSLGSTLAGMIPMASGGAVGSELKPYSSDDLHEKVGKAFRLFHNLRKEASGGRIEPFAFGGDVGLESWAPTVTPADPVTPASNEGFMKTLGGKLGKVADSMGDDPKGKDDPLAGPSALGQQQQALGSFLDGLQHRPYGGAVEDSSLSPFGSAGDRYGEDSEPSHSGLSPFVGETRNAADAPSAGTDYHPVDAPSRTSAASSESGFDWHSLIPHLPHLNGVFAGQQMTPWQRAMGSLSQVGDFAPVGKAWFEANEGRLKQLESDREAAMNPAKIEQLNASSALARTQADKNFLLDIEKKKMQYGKELELAKTKAQYNMVQGILDKNGQKAIPSPQSEDDLESLAPGTIFRAPDGSVRVR